MPTHLIVNKFTTNKVQIIEVSQNYLTCINDKWILGEKHVWADHTDVAFSLGMMNLMLEVPKGDRDFQCMIENRGSQKSHKKYWAEPGNPEAKKRRGIKSCKTDVLTTQHMLSEDAKIIAWLKMVWNFYL